jgi:hypothetical protein
VVELLRNHPDVVQGLVLLSLTSEGRLPWSVAKSDAECLKMKESCDIRKLCAQQGVPEVAELILQCRSAARHVRPDYAAMGAILSKMRDRKVSCVAETRTCPYSVTDWCVVGTVCRPRRRSLLLWLQLATHLRRGVLARKPP